MTTEPWRPIATAPTDATAVLLAWDVGFYTPTVGYFGTYHPNAKGKAEWREGGGPIGGNKFARQPTHWLPLPPNPVAAA